ncbi:hypothetical protein LDENG_00077150 [Lucifuga dentata]|nr:hypothetical protein LDENG_00077150 [Lucifuga dentata]
MVKKQRGKTSSSSKTEKLNPTEKLSLSPESSDDEAPEEVTFEDSRTQALRSIKQALDTARRENELLKEKRRKRQELFQEQKKRKLPADVLEEISTAAAKKQKSSQDEAEEEQREDEEAGEEEDGEEVEVENETKKKKKTQKLPHVRHLKGNYTVRTVKEGTSASFQQQAAMDFLQSRLYAPGSRTTNNELLSLQNKKGRNKSAAVQFVKSGWACREKAKAEKLKKRWINKQQIPSS